MAARINRDFFFDHVRAALFAGSLKQKQVDGLTALLDYWEEKHSTKDDRWLAYILGTAYHEVDKRMQPIDEYGGTAYFMMMYDKTGSRPAKAEELGNTEIGDGARFHGRGFVQLTGRRNYKDWSNRLGVNLVANPEKAKDLKIATKIIIEGMILGTFTTKKLSTYFHGNTADWVRARRTVNGLNKANLIADYARSFYSAISYTTG